MTTKRIIYTRPDGGVSVVCPTPEFMSSFENESEAISALREKNVPADATNIKECNVADLPHRDSFRSAWTQTGDTPTVDMAKARVIKTDQIRPERNKRLADLDVTYLRADEAGDTATKEKIAVQKQKMRDLPATIQSDLNALNTPEELESFTPTWPSLE